MRILLIGSSRTILGFDRVTRLPNLGLNSIASNILDDDIDIKILDLVLVKKKVDEYLLKYIRFYKPDVVGFSCMTFQYDHVIQLVRLIKEYNSQIKIVIGGYHPTVDFENIFESDQKEYIDFILRNEGEITFNLLIEQIRGKRQYHKIPSLSYKDNGTAIHNPVGEVLDLEDVKFPDREKRILNRGFHILGIPADVIETSRGCVNRCRFCSIRQMYGSTFRKYKIERVIRDIRHACDYGARAILLADDNITVDAVRFENICEEIIRHKLNHVKYAVQASIPGLKRAPRLPRLMSEAGVDICFLGIENSLDKTIGFLNTKSIGFSETKDVIGELQGNGITVIGSFIIGNPDDTREIIIENFRFANNIEVDVPLFLILTPFPKTEIREDLFQQELITNKDDYSKYDLFHANVRTHHLSSQDLEKIRDEIAFKIFRNNTRIWKFVRKYPCFSTRLLLDQIVNEPREVLGYIQGAFH